MYKYNNSWPHQKMFNLVFIIILSIFNEFYPGPFFTIWHVFNPERVKRISLHPLFVSFVEQQITPCLSLWQNWDIWNLISLFCKLSHVIFYQIHIEVKLYRTSFLIDMTRIEKESRSYRTVRDDSTCTVIDVDIISKLCTAPVRSILYLDCTGTGTR